MAAMKKGKQQTPAPAPDPTPREQEPEPEPEPALVANGVGEQVMTQLAIAGATFRAEYWMMPWPSNPEDHGLFVNHLELLTTLGAMETWGPGLRHQRILMNGDNEVAVGVHNKGATKEAALDAMWDVPFRSGTDWRGADSLSLITLSRPRGG